MSNGKVGIFIDKIEFYNGLQLKLQDNSIVVLVGPNNSGKSVSLKDIFGIINGRFLEGISIKRLSIQKIGNKEDLKEFLQPFRSKNEERYNVSPAEHESISESGALEAWDSENSQLEGLAKLFVGHLTTETRLADCSPVENFDAINKSRGSHPIHALYQDSNLETKVSDLFFQAFSKDLVVHKNAGRKIPLYVGVRPPLKDGENPVSRSYLDKIEKLEPLVDQGDGLKSFASLLLRVWTGSHTVLLLDEPEAFLHPPQARAVGELISSGAEYEKQIFVATHSNDVIQGMLSKFPGRISVVRLQREGVKPTATYLHNHQIEQLWRDPILRYSNILNGLFHSRVIVTEADGDCRFYEAIAGCQPQTISTTFYTYAGGKDRIPTIIRALHALQVPVRTIVDFDIISEDKSIKNLIEAHGGLWSDFQDDVHQIRAVIQGKKSWLVGSGFKSRVKELLDSIDDKSIVDKSTLSKLKVLMREASPWDAVKAAGMAAVPSGDPTKNLQNLLFRLKEVNIFVVPVGEMEGFCRSVGAHGPRWVDQVLAREICSDVELDGARMFVSDVVNNLVLELKGGANSHIETKRMVTGRFFNFNSRSRIILRSIVNFAKSIFFVLGALYFIITFVAVFIQVLKKNS